MSPTTVRNRPAPSRRTLLMIGVGAAILVVSLAVALVASTGPAPPGATVTGTGQVNAMGMPVVDTPGEATGDVRAGPVTVRGASWALGTVPLDVAVRAHWTLRNTGADPVTVAQPHPEVRAGCCPGAFTIDDPVIPAGGEAILTFELSMHEGMDGWHDIAVHVPVQTPAGEEVLALDVTGDFRNA